MFRRCLFQRCAPPSGGIAAGVTNAVSMKQRVVDMLHQKPTDNALYTLADVNGGRVWNYDLPTITERNRFIARQPWSSCSEFSEAFYAKFPIFKHIDMTNIAVMGGTPFDFLTGKESRIRDIDLFLVGDLPEAGSSSTTSNGDWGSSASSTTLSNDARVVARAERFIADVYRYLEHYVTWHNKAIDAAKERGASSGNVEKMVLSSLLQGFQASRNGPVITFTIPTVSVPIQLVLSSHKSVQDLLRRADLDCTAIAFVDGKSLYFNTISKFCFENGCAIVGLSAGRAFESRISKYFTAKDVDIILPFLDLSKVPTRNLKYKVDEVLDLSRMAVIFHEILPPAKIIARQLVPNTTLDVKTTSEDGNKRWLVPPSGGSTTYGGGGDEKGVKNAGVIIHENLIHLIHGHFDKFQFNGDGKFVKNVLLPIPKFTKRMIANSYEKVRHLAHAFGEGKIDTELLEKYYTVKPTSEIVMDILVRPLQKGEASLKAAAALSSASSSSSSSSGDDDDGAQLGGLASALGKDHKEFIKAYFDDLTEKQIAFAWEKVKEVEAAYEANPSRFRVASTIALESFTIDEWYGAQYTTKPSA